MNELDNAGQHRDVVIRPDPEVTGSNPPARLDSGGFRQHEAGTTNRSRA
jgi:hypothetical protein